VRRRERDVDVARLPDRLPPVERLRHGQLARALLDEAREPEEVLRPLGRGERGPAVLERAARSVDGQRDVLLARERDLEQRLLRRRRDRLEPLAGLRLDLLPTDEEPVAVAKLDDVPRLGRRGVFPLERRGHAGGALLDLGHQSMVK
jgi:hypothetical protein